MYIKNIKDMSAFYQLLLLLLVLLLLCVIPAKTSLASNSTSNSNIAASTAPTHADNDELIDFSSIKQVIKNDMLENVVVKKNEAILDVRNEKLKKKTKLYDFPSRENFWSLISEYWLVKNAQSLKWDFEKPDYGIDEAVKALFEGLGHYEVRFKLLVINDISPTHFSLPADSGEYIFILSLPFIRTMDLSKLEISLLILEDFYRANFEYFKQYANDKEIDDFFGKNFYNKKFDFEKINKILKSYTYFINEKGFSFPQQYDVTKKVSEVIRSNPNLWKTYNNLLYKIDTLIKNNGEYKSYNKIYPSPEMQLRWLKTSKL
ncbi:MAG: hypothetical protein HQK53_01505 [Oligoflexia bacterium]|nr:hypothetical protein [Oligoflexia bacterium]